MISKEVENELYSFIVDSNLEQSIIDQCENEFIKKQLIEYFQMGEDEK